MPGVVVQMEEDLSEETPTIEKPVVEKPRKDGLLKFITELVESSDDGSVMAAAKIVRHFSQGFATSKEGSKESEALKTELDYALKRLVSGLTSTDCRPKFFACLRELLESIPQINPFKILEVAESSMKLTHNSSRKERGEVNLGKVMTAALCIESKLDLQKAEVEDWKRLFKCLFEVLGERKFVSAQAGEFLAKLLIANPFGEKHSDEIYQFCLELVETAKGNNVGKFELMFVSLCVENAGYTSDRLTALANSLAESDSFLSSDAWVKIADLVMKQAATYPVVHPFVGLLVEVLGGRKSLVEFWGQFSSRDEQGRNEICLQLHFLKLMLPFLTKGAHVEAVFTPKVLGLILKVAQLECVGGRIKKTKAEKLITGKHKPVQALMAAVVERFGKKDEGLAKARKAVIKALISAPGSIDFDKAVGAKCVHDLIWSSDDSRIVKMVANYCRDALIMKFEPVDRPKPKNDARDDAEPESKPKMPYFQRRLYAGNLLSKLLNHPSVTKEDEWRWDQIQLLIALGLFKPRTKKSGGFETCLGFQHNWAFDEGAVELSNHLILGAEASFMQSLPASKERKRQLASVLFKVGQLIEGLADFDGIEPISKVSEKGKEEWMKAWKLVQKLNKKRTKGKLGDEEATGDMFIILFVLIGMRVFSDEKSALECLEDLHECFERALGKKKEEKEEGGEDLHWVRVVTNILLRLLANENRVLRGVVTSVFQLLVPELTKEAYDDILEVVDPQEDEPLLEIEDDEDMDAEGEGDEDEGKDEKDSEEDDDSGGEDSDENGQVDSEFRDTVKAALGDSAMATDIETINASDVDEARMEELDAALANVFKNTTRGAKSLAKLNQDAFQKELSFRLRVVDLIEAVLTASPPNYDFKTFVGILERVVSGLVKCAGDLRAYQPLAARLVSLLNKVCGLKNFKERPKAGSVEEVVGCLGKMAEHLKQPFSPQISNAISKCCTLVVRETVHSGEVGVQAIDPVLSVYEKILDAFMKGSGVVPASFFRDTLSLTWAGNAGLMNLIATRAFDQSNRWYARAALVGFLRHAVKNHQVFKLPGIKIKSTLKAILSGGIKEMDLIQSETDVKTRLLSECLELILAVLNLETVIGRKSGPKDTEEVKRAMVGLAGRIRIKKRADAWKAFRKLKQKVGLKDEDMPEPPPLPEKEPANPPEEGKKSKKVKRKSETAAEPKKTEGEQPKKKKKKNLEKTRKRREEEERRLARFNDGVLGEVKFSAVGNPDVPEPEPE